MSRVTTTPDPAGTGAGSVPDHAVSLFDPGFNCAGSAVIALLSAKGRDTAQAQRMATAFGAGLAGAAALSMSLVLLLISQDIIRL